MLCSPCAQVPGSQWVGSVGMNTLGKRELCVGKKAEGPCLEQMWNGKFLNSIFKILLVNSIPDVSLSYSSLIPNSSLYFQQPSRFNLSPLISFSKIEFLGREG